MNLVNLIWGSGKNAATLEKVDEGFVLVGENRVHSLSASNELHAQSASSGGHSLPFSASICSVSDAERILKIYQERHCNSNRFPSLQINEEGPYAQAFCSKIEKTERTTSRVHYFLNGEILGARGTMVGSERIKLLTGREVFCATQALKDLTRWNAQTHISFGDGAFCLAPDTNSDKLVISIGVTRTLPIRFVSLLARIETALGNDKIFETFTKFFNQGPFNDMIYRMMADVYSQWGVSLFPCQKITQSFHVKITVVNNNNHLSRKVIIAVKGYFNGGAIGDRGVIEPKEGQELGVFSGTTVINLNSGAGSVETEVEVFPSLWDKLLKSV